LYGRSLICETNVGIVLIKIKNKLKGNKMV